MVLSLLYHLGITLFFIYIGTPVARALGEEPSIGTRVLMGLSLFIIVTTTLLVLGVPLAWGVAFLALVVGGWWVGKLISRPPRKDQKPLLGVWDLVTYLFSLLFFVTALLVPLIHGRVAPTGVNSDAVAYCAVTQYLLHHGLPVPHPPTPYHLKWVQLHPLNGGLRMGFNVLHGLISLTGPWDVPSSLPMAMAMFLSFIPWAVSMKERKRSWVSMLVFLPALFIAAYDNYAALCCFFPLFTALILTGGEPNREVVKPFQYDRRALLREAVFAGALLACYPIGILYWLFYKGIYALMRKRPAFILRALLSLVIIPSSLWFLRGLVVEVIFASKKVCGNASGPPSIPGALGIKSPVGLVILGCICVVILFYALSRPSHRIRALALIAPFLGVALFYLFVSPYPYAVEKNMVMLLILLPIISLSLAEDKGWLALIVPLLLVLLPISYASTLQTAKATPLENLKRMKALAHMANGVPKDEVLHLFDTSPKENLWIVYFSPSRPFVLNHFTPNFIYKGAFAPDRYNEELLFQPPHAHIKDLWRGAFGKTPTFYSPVVKAPWALLAKWRIDKVPSPPPVLGEEAGLALVKKPKGLSFYTFPTFRAIYLEKPMSIVVRNHQLIVRMGEETRLGPLPPFDSLVLGRGVYIGSYPENKTLNVSKNRVFWGWIGGSQGPLSKTSPFLPAPSLMPHSSIFILQGWYPFALAYGTVARWSKIKAYFGMICPKGRRQTLELTVQPPLVSQEVTLTLPTGKLTLDKAEMSKVSIPVCSERNKGYEIIKVECEKGFIPDEILHNGDIRRLCLLPLKAVIK